MRLVNRPLTDDLRAKLRLVTKRDSPFNTSWRTTLSLLTKECEHLLKPGAWEVVLMIDVDENMLRLDGELRANARPHSPNCAIALESRNGPLIFPSAKFWDWRDNVRAIALGMEALRKVDRYGISPHGEQYRGWQAIGSGTPMAGRMKDWTHERACAVLGLQQRVFPETINDARQELARIHHPDRGGDPEKMVEVNLAADFLLAELAAG